MQCESPEQIILLVIKQSNNFLKSVKLKDTTYEHIIFVYKMASPVYHKSYLVTYKPESLE